MRCAGVGHYGNFFCSVLLPTKSTPNLFFSFRVFPLFVFLLVFGIIAGWVCLFVCVIGGVNLSFRRSSGWPQTDDNSPASTFGVLEL